MPLDPTQPTVQPDGSPTPTTDPGPQAPAAEDAPAPEDLLPQAGDLVTFRFTDMVTGSDLSGSGVVRSSGEGGVQVAPLSPYLLQLAPDQVTVVHRPERA
jgi:hypothetical protein